jgi:hypothetical protein
VSNETWATVFESLKAHPTLEVLDIRGALMNAAPAPAVLKSWMQALVDMMKVNMSIHTIRLDPPYSQHELFRGSVIPYLETNRFRPHLLAIQKTRPIPYRAKVLGRALLVVRMDPNRFWMLLSGNVEVAIPSTTATIAAVASLPTPSTDTTVPESLPTAAAATATRAATPSTASASDATTVTTEGNRQRIETDRLTRVVQEEEGAPTAAEVVSVRRSNRTHSTPNRLGF